MYCGFSVFFVSKASLNYESLLKGTDMSYRVILHKSFTDPNIPSPVNFECYRELPFPPYLNLRLDFANVTFLIDNISYDTRYEVFHCYEYNVVKEDFDFEGCEKFHRDNFWIKK